MNKLIDTIEQLKQEKSSAEKKADDEFKIRTRTQEESKKIVDESRKEANKITAKQTIRLNQKFWDSKKKSKFMSKINRKNNNNYSSK